MQPKVQLKALTGIRFFAALVVIAYHLFLAAPAKFPPYVASLASYGFVGVSLFFVLSGFVMAYTYIGKPMDRQKFWVARFARIYPAYLIALVLGLLTYNDIAQQHSLGRTLGQIILEGALLHAWLPWTACGVNCPGWSVSVEVFFYAIFPWVVLACARYVERISIKQTVVAIVVLWVIALIAPSAYLLSLHHFPSEAARAATFDAVIYNPLLNAPQFLMGVAAGLLFLRKRNSKPVTATTTHPPTRSEGLALVLGILALAVLMLAPADNGYLSTMLRNGLFSPLFALGIYALAHGHGLLARALALPLFTLLGEVSYGIYVLETPLNRLLRSASDVGWLPTYGSMAYGVIFLLVLIGLSIVSFYLIETPARKRITQRSKKQTTLLGA